MERQRKFVNLLTQSDNHIIQTQEKTNLVQLSSNVLVFEVTSRFTADVLETLRYVAKQADVDSPTRFFRKVTVSRCSSAIAAC